MLVKEKGWTHDHPRRRSHRYHWAISTFKYLSGSLYTCCKQGVLAWPRWPLDPRSNDEEFWLQGSTGPISSLFIHPVSQPPPCFCYNLSYPAARAKVASPCPSFPLSLTQAAARAWVASLSLSPSPSLSLSCDGSPLSQIPLQPSTSAGTLHIAMPCTWQRSARFLEWRGVPMLTRPGQLCHHCRSNIDAQLSKLPATSAPPASSTSDSRSNGHTTTPSIAVPSLTFATSMWAATPICLPPTSTQLAGPS